jgi:polyisoprenoid-binding protein YceI
MKRILFAAACLLFPIMAFSQTTWNANKGIVTFKIKNAGSNVDGSFTGMQATLVFSPDKLDASQLGGTVQVSTINTGISQRDHDLQGEKYFNAGKYPSIEIKSTKLYQKGNGYAGMFNVTIKGTTKQVEIPFTFTQNGNEAEFSGSFGINRRDFGVGTKGGLGMMLSDDVHVSIDVKAKQ